MLFLAPFFSLSLEKSWNCILNQSLRLRMTNGHTETNVYEILIDKRYWWCKSVRTLYILNSFNEKPQNFVLKSCSPRYVHINFSQWKTNQKCRDKMWAALLMKCPQIQQTPGLRQVQLQHSEFSTHSVWQLFFPSNSETLHFWKYFILSIISPMDTVGTISYLFVLCSHY